MSNRRTREMKAISPSMVAVTALIAALAAACASARLGPGYALYPNPQNRFPDDRVAKLVGPIGSVDGRDVSALSAQGVVFDLLPGCHVAQLNGDMIRTNDYVTWVGPIPRFVFALRMKAGHRYFIRREIIRGIDSTSGRVIAIAHEEDSAGASTPLSPVQKGEDIRACEDWAARGP